MYFNKQRKQYPTPNMLTLECQYQNETFPVIGIKNKTFLLKQRLYPKSLDHPRILLVFYCFLINIPQKFLLQQIIQPLYADPSSTHNA